MAVSTQHQVEIQVGGGALPLRARGVARPAARGGGGGAGGGPGAATAPAPLAGHGPSAALVVAGLPCDGPVGAVRVGLIGEQFVVNPTLRQTEEESRLDLVVAGAAGAVLMVRAGAQ